MSYKPFTYNPDWIANCSECGTEIEEMDKGIWYLRRPAHEVCVTQLGTFVERVRTDYLPERGLR